MQNNNESCEDEEATISETNNAPTAPLAHDTNIQRPMETSAPSMAAADTQTPAAETANATEPSTSAQQTSRPTVEAGTQLKAVDNTPDEKEELARRYERAQAIFKKYSVDFDEAGWDARSKPQVERVYKAPRMRVRWTCHECKTTFGHDKICVECAHQRCRTCARYPPKKRKPKAAKQAALAASMADISEQEARDGACHECQTPFDLGTEECSNCHHIICERCLQETLASAEPSESQAATV